MSTNSELTKKLEGAVAHICKAAANKAALTMNQEYDCLKWKRVGDGDAQNGMGRQILMHELLRFMHPDWIRIAQKEADSQQQKDLLSEGEGPINYDYHWVMFFSMEQILLALKDYHQQHLYEYYSDKLMEKIVHEFAKDPAADEDFSFRALVSSEQDDSDE